MRSSCIYCARARACAAVMRYSATVTLNGKKPKKKKKKNKEMKGNGAKKTTHWFFVSLLCRSVCLSICLCPLFLPRSRYLIGWRFYLDSFFSSFFHPFSHPPLLPLLSSSALFQHRLGGRRLTLRGRSSRTSSLKCWICWRNARWSAGCWCLWQLRDAGVSRACPQS